MRRLTANWAIVASGFASAAIFIGYGSYKLVRTAPVPAAILAPLEPSAAAPVAAYVVTKMPIARGARIEREALETLAISGPPPAEATTSFSAVVGKTAMSDMPAHQLVLNSLITADPGRAGLAFIIAPGYRAITLRTNDEIAVGNFIHPSDRIDINLVLHPNVLPKQTDAQAQADGDPSEAHTVLQAIEVLAVGDTLGDQAIVEAARSAQGTAATGRHPDPPKSITVAMTPDQISQFTLARSLGSFYLTLRNPTDPQVITSDPAALKDIRGRTPPPTAPVAQADRPIELITGNRSQTIYSTSRGSR